MAILCFCISRKDFLPFCGILGVAVLYFGISRKDFSLILWVSSFD